MRTHPAPPGVGVGHRVARVAALIGLAGPVAVPARNGDGRRVGAYLCRRRSKGPGLWVRGAGHAAQQSAELLDFGRTLGAICGRGARCDL